MKRRVYGSSVYQKSLNTSLKLPETEFRLRENTALPCTKFPRQIQEQAKRYYPICWALSSCFNFVKGIILNIIKAITMKTKILTSNFMVLRESVCLVERRIDAPAQSG